MRCEACQRTVQIVVCNGRDCGMILCQDCVKKHAPVCSNRRDKAEYSQDFGDEIERHI
jgi:hypothetical protein